MRKRKQPLKHLLVSHELKRKRMSSAESRCKASPESRVQQVVPLDATGECCSSDDIRHSDWTMPIGRRQLPGCCFPPCSQRPSAFSLAAQWSSPRWFQPWPRSWEIISMSNEQMKVTKPSLPQLRSAMPSLVWLDQYGGHLSDSQTY